MKAMRQAMKHFFSDIQSRHAPLRELNNGKWMDYAECPDRIASILDAVGPFEEPRDHGLDPILAVHDARYVDFLRKAHDDWLAVGRKGDALGYAFPIVRRRELSLERIDAKLGAFGFDAATPIAQGTWEAAYWGAQSALSAFDAVAGRGESAAFALCRPPGHHAGADYYGGYCYLNNAAIVAEAAKARGLGPVAVLDVDYHHGNGTQDIFYADGQVLFVSIHADPASDYPYFWGHADETGEAEGEGTTLNLPLPRGTTWPQYEQTLERACDAIAAFGAQFCVVSYGADTFVDDPISHFALTTSDMERVGTRIGSLKLPTTIVMEGGYDIPALGANVASFLQETER
jgi:acetoin utilization deacetylase AcuC-like enzyme